MDTIDPKHQPTDEQKHNLAGIMHGADGVALMRVKHKATGEWRTLLMIVQRAPNNEVYTYIVGTMMEDADVATSVRDYELPVGAIPQNEQQYKEAMGGPAMGMIEDPTNDLMDRIFPNRKKD